MLSNDRLKRLLAVTAGVGAATLAYARFIEPQRVSLDRYIVPVDWPSLPADGLTILHLSDLHWRAGGAVQAAKLARLQKLLAGESYDLLVLTGDLIHDDAGLPAALAFIETLRPRLAAFSCPGNRDYWQSSFRALLAPAEDASMRLDVRVSRVAARLIDFARKARANERWSLHVRPNDTAALHAGLIALGVQPLVNASAHVVGNGIDLWIAGIDDLNQGQPDLVKALDGVPAKAPVIVLAHNPDAWLDPAIAQADLVLAGHTHGGQFRLPLIGALHTQGTYLSRQRPAGWFERGRARMFVSRGLGESFPFRFGAPPQAVLIRLQPANSFAGRYPKSAEADWVQMYIGRNAMKKWIGGALLGAAIVGGGAALYASQVERADVQLDRFTVEVDRSGLPPDGLVVLHLSDFHFRAGGRVQARKIARLKQLLAGERYDIVALTGDLIHDAAGLPTALSLIESLRPGLGAYSCRGNHDYVEYSVWGVFGHTWRETGGAGGLTLGDLLATARKLADFGRKVLRNELVRLPVAFNDMAAMDAGLISAGVQPLVNTAVQVPGTDLWVAGVDDLTEGFPDLRVALNDVPDEPPVILLAHNPDIWLNARVAAADLVLSGHTHGGQVRLPGVGVIHTQGTHLTRQRPAGWFEREGTRMFVSRGLGESIPLRFGVRPQIALIRLISK